MDEKLRKLAKELEDAGALDLGSLYSWPRSSGGYLDVYGFGLMRTPKGIKFVSAHNSAKAGGMKFTYLEPELPLKMIAQGEVKYQGNILDPEWRKKNADWEKISLSICGFLSAFESIRLGKQTSVNDILAKLESGEMTLEQLMEKCKIDSALRPEEVE